MFPIIELYGRQKYLSDDIYSNILYDVAKYASTIDEMDLAEKYLKISSEKGFIKAMVALGCIYEKKDIYDEMKKYYLMGIEKDCTNCMFRLATFYKNSGNLEEMKKYYLMGVEKDCVKCMVNMSLYYSEIKDSVNKEKYIRLAIVTDKKDSVAINILCIYLESSKKYDEMKKHYLNGVNLGYSKCMFNFAEYYRKIEKNYEEMCKYYFMAIDKNKTNIIYEIKNNKKNIYYKIAKAIYNFCNLNMIDEAKKFILQLQMLDKKFFDLNLVLNDINNRFSSLSICSSFDTFKKYFVKDTYNKYDLLHIPINIRYKKDEIFTNLCLANKIKRAKWICEFFPECEYEIKIENEKIVYFYMPGKYCDKKLILYEDNDNIDI